jgi:flagellar motor switch protein FliN
MSEDQISEEEALSDEWAAALEEQGPAGAEAAQFQQLQPDARGGGSGDVKIDAILDVPITISMEIGRARINIRNLLQLNQGSVVELDRLAGEPMDVLVNGTLIAQGEVVVVNEKFGIRLTDIVSPADRVKKLSG